MVLARPSMGSQICPNLTSPRPTSSRRSSRPRASASDSLMIEAYAGCAKTTSLELLGRRVRTPALALAFNKSIAVELQVRFAANFEVKTMNGFGFGALRRGSATVSNWTLDDRKVGKIVSQIARDQKVDLASRRMGLDPAGGLGRAERGLRAERGDGCGRSGATSRPIIGLRWTSKARGWRTWRFAKTIRPSNGGSFRSTIRSIGQPSTPSISLPKFPAILVDEAQDLSPLQHAMLGKATGPACRLFVCGDPRQAIYSFAGRIAQAWRRSATSGQIGFADRSR